MIPRAASASITRGSLRSATSHSWYSSMVMFGCAPGRCLARRDAVLADSDDRAVGLCPSRFQQMHDALAAAGAGAHSRSDRLGRLAQLDEAKRQPSPTPCSRRSDAAASADLVGGQRIERMRGHGRD